MYKNKNIEHIEVPTKRLRYTLASLPKPAIQLVFRHDYVEGNLTNVPGFSLSWRVANKSFTSKTPVLRLLSVSITPKLSIDDLSNPQTVLVV